MEEECPTTMCYLNSNASANSNNLPRSFEGKDNEESKSFESSHNPLTLPNDDYFIVKNPLVLLICCNQYEGGWDPLPGVNTDHKILYELFHGFYGWEVDSIQNGTKNAILDFLEVHIADIVKSKEQCLANYIVPTCPVSLLF